MDGTTLANGLYDLRAQLDNAEVGGGQVGNWTGSRANVAGEVLQLGTSRVLDVDCHQAGLQ
jgi:hypothetical protein